MAVRDLGDAMRLEYQTVDADGNPVAATVALTVTSPSGVTSTPAVTSPVLGTYRSTFTLTAAGAWFWQWTASGTVIDVEYGDVEVSAKSPTWYTSLAMARKACGGLPEGDPDKDDLLIAAIAGSSRGIDNRCGFPRRRFYRDKDVSARLFAVAERGRYDRCTGEWVFDVDDLASTTDLALATSMDGTTWTTVAASAVTPCGQDGDRNAPGNMQAVCELRSYGAAWWAGGRLARVTERWGWPAIPDTISEAALLQTSRLFARRNSPEGVLGNAEWGIARVSRLDPDVRAMIGDYVLDGIA